MAPERRRIRQVRFDQYRCWERDLAVATTVKVPAGREEEETGHFKPAQARDLGKVTAGVKQEFLVSLSFWV